jgi:hypothetical protein
MTNTINTTQAFKHGTLVIWRPMLRSAAALRAHKLNTVGKITDTVYGEATGHLVTVKWRDGREQVESTRDLQPAPCAK